MDSAAVKRICLIINGLILAVGNCGGPLVMRLYFIHGGKRVWFSAWLETGGWPVILIPLTIAYFRRLRQAATPPKIFFMKRRVFGASVVIGILTGMVDYLYAFGVAKLPLSTSAVIVASQLAFTAVFAYLFVKHKFTPYSINAIVTLLVGAVVLAIHSDSDRPKGESSKEYLLGFFMTVMGAFLYGVILPLMELTYLKANQQITYTLVLEIQLVTNFSATVFCTIGMLINHDFQAIPKEAEAYALGSTMYILVVLCNGVMWQCFYLGAIGVIFYASSLLSAIIIHALLPTTELLAVLFYHESFQAEKGISLFLCLWGFTSYFYGEIKRERRNKRKNLESNQTTELQVTSTHSPANV
ncbi:purine permease 3-like [Andrographis paniculata]|uniref:purine permease 3-like n=1 Tax=Andrographis paniculata TaxID=175694 RepID=UPI0021E98372|nr:purine permease 3-like [Andrographis paniculata]